MSIGKRLKEARKAAGMTQEELARAIGITKGSIGNYESEVSSPKEPILIKLMETLSIDANYVYQDFMNSSVFTDEEIILVNAFRKADPGIRSSVRKLLDISDVGK